MWIFAVIGFVLSVLLTLLVKRLALKWKILDKPDSKRKFHQRAVPLLGGVAIFAAFWLMVACLIFFHPIFGIEILKGKLTAAFLASFLIVVVGIVDDIYSLPALPRLIYTIGAVLIAIYFGINLDKVTNPAGGVLRLGTIFGGVSVFIWLLLMMYTTKLTDGLDGLATGIVTIGSIIIYFLTKSKVFFQPNVALLSLIFAAVCLGFLVFNFYPASIFLGESGSLFIGFMLGVLAVISGGKVATALLVMAVPTFDIARVVFRRLKKGQKIFEGDRLHLHYQLLDSGWSVSKVVLVYYALATVFGILALILQSTAKLIVIVFLILGMVVLALRLPEAEKN